MRRIGLLALVAFALACCATPAAADTSISAQGRTLIVFSEDPGIKNKMTIEERAGNLIISDESDPFGMRSEPPCTPQRFNSGNAATQVSCPKANFDAIQVSLGGSEDTLNVKITPPFFVSAAGETAADVLTTGDTDDVVTGEQGNDTLDSGAGNDDVDGGDGNDTISAGAGNDKIQGAGGTDTITAGAGDDNIKTPDGNVDKLTCGEGSDTVVADTIDEVAPDCESVTRQFVAPPQDQPVGDDKKAPRCAAGGSTAQKVGGKRRSLYIAATSSEIGEIAASGFLDVGGINVAIRPRVKKVTVAGGGVELKFTFSKTVLKQIARDHKRGKKPVARMKVVATDRAGNASKSVTFKIVLR